VVFEFQKTSIAQELPKSQGRLDYLENILKKNNSGFFVGGKVRTPFKPNYRLYVRCNIFLKTKNEVKADFH